MQHYANRPERASGLNDFMRQAINQYANLGLGALEGYEQRLSDVGTRGGMAQAEMLQQAQGLRNLQGYMPRMMQGQTGTAAQAAYDPRLAQAIMQGAPVDQAITAATRDIYRNLGEQQLPGIGMAAAGADQTGGSRRAVAEAIAARGAQDRAGDIAAQMYNQAYGQGVGVASQYGLSNAQLAQQMGLANLSNLQQQQLANQAASNQAMQFNRNLNLQGQGLAGNLYGQLSGQTLPGISQAAGLRTAAPGYLMTAGQTERDAPWQYAQQFSQTVLPWAIPGAPGMPQQNPWTTPEGIGSLLEGVGSFMTGYKKGA